MAYYGPEQILSTMSVRQSLGMEASAATTYTISGTTYTANRATYMPIYFDYPGIVTKLWSFNGTVVSGNIDMGLYESALGLPTTRVASGGGAAQAGTSAMQEFDVTDVPVRAQSVYFVAFALDNGTGTIFRANVNNVSLTRSMGFMQQASAYPLPSTATPITNTLSVLPYVGVSFRALVA